MSRGVDQKASPNRCRPAPQEDLRVAAGLLTSEGKVLLCQRRRGDRHGLKWEFPGGKALAGEDTAACLRRELGEELGIDADVGCVLWRTRHRYPDGTRVSLTFLHVPHFRGDIRNLAFERVLWAKPETLGSYDFLAGDAGFIRAISRGRVRVPGAPVGGLAGAGLTPP